MKGKQHSVLLNKNQRLILVSIYISETHDGIVLGLKDLTQKLNLSYKIVYHSVDKLIKLGLLISDAKFTVYQLKVSDKGKIFLDAHIKNLPNNDWYVNSFLDRAHRITILMPIIQRGNTPDGFNESPFSKKLNWPNPQLTLRLPNDNLSIRITPRNVVFHFNNFIGITAEHVTSLCLTISFRYVTKLLLSKGWKIGTPHSCIVDQHHALSNKNLAKYTSKYDIYYLSDRLSFDKSVSPNEIELVHPTHSSDDFLKLTDFFEAIIRDDLKLSDLRRLIKRELHKHI